MRATCSDRRANVDEALDAIAEEVPDLVLCDWRMPGRDGGELLAEVRRRGLGCGFIVMTAYGSIAHAVEAVRLGADDYLGKPFEREALLLAVHRVLKTRRLENENRRLREAVGEEDRFGSLIGGTAGHETPLPHHREGRGDRRHGAHHR